MTVTRLAVAVVVLLAMTGAVVASSHSGLVVGSIHSTDSELGAGTLTNMEVEGTGTGASVGLLTEGTATSRPDDDNSVTNTDDRRYGIRLSPNVDLVEVSVTVSSGTNADRVTLMDESANVISEKSGSYTGGDVVTFDQDLDSSEDYLVTVDGDDGEFDLGIYGNPSFPYPSRDVTLVESVDILGGDVQGVTSSAYAISGIAANVENIDNSGQYDSDTHVVENADQAFINTTLEDAHADYRIEYGGSGSWQTAASGTLSSTGNHSIDISGHETETEWRSNVTLVNETTDETVAEIHDEGIRFEARAPTASNPSPAGGEIITAGGPTLSADINDSDFDITQGDEVTADVYLDGSQVDSQTLSSNETVTYQASGLDGGAHDWHVELEDDYGLQTTSQTWAFDTPDELRVYNESSPDDLVEDPVDVSVQFFAANGSVYERSTDDGVIDFSGLPVDQSFVAQAATESSETDPSYLSRTIYVESLIEQQEIYLLNENVESANIVFTLVDNTGQFSPPGETTLFVEKPLNQSGDTVYRTITSDQFSATNDIPTTLEDDQRYRLRLEGPDGGTRVLGAYTAAGDDAPTLTVGQVSFGGASPEGPAFSAHIEDIEGTRMLRIAYDDPADATSELQLEVVNRSDPSDVLRPTTTETGPFGRYTENIPLSTTRENVAYNVTYHATRTGMDDSAGTVAVGDVAGIAGAIGLDSEIMSAIGFLTIFGVLGLTAISHPRFAGIPTVVVAMGLVTFGALAIHPLLLAGAGVVALLFAVGGGR